MGRSLKPRQTTRRCFALSWPDRLGCFVVWLHDARWHFKHFLDSPDQALLMTALFADVVPGAGGTFIAADSHKHVAQWFSDHPEGSQGLPGDVTKRKSIRST